jgi:hypothetical protein
MSSPQVGSDGSPVVDRRRPMVVSGFTTPYKVLSSPLSSRQAKGNPKLPRVHQMPHSLLVIEGINTILPSVAVVR